MDITFNADFGENLGYALQTPVLGYQADFQIGDLHRLTDATNPFWRFKATYDRAHTAMELFTAGQTARQQLLTAVQQGEPLRVWWSDSTDDRIGFYWLCHELPAAVTNLTAIQVPLESPLVNAEPLLEHLSELGELSAQRVAQYLPLARPVTPAERTAYGFIWRDLVEENAPLRVNLNDRVLGVAEDFYDGFLQSRMHADWRPARIVGETLGEFPVGIPEWWYFYRLDVLREQS